MSMVHVPGIKYKRFHTVDLLSLSYKNDIDGQIIGEYP